MTKIFFGGFPLEYNELDLVRLVSIHGDVSTIKIVRDRRTGKCKGYAFLELDTPEGAERAVAALTGPSWKAVS